MTVVAHVLLVLQMKAVLFLQEVDWAIRWRDVPVDPGLFPHVVPQELPQCLAEDHVLEVGNLGKDVLGKSVRNGTHEKRVLWLAINDALEDVVLLEANCDEEKLRRKLSLLRRTKSPLLALLFLGQAPVP